MYLHGSLRLCLLHAPGLGIAARPVTALNSLHCFNMEWFRSFLSSMIDGVNKINMCNLTRVAQPLAYMIMS